jgi:molybdate transport system substrate-binding protein
MKKTIVALLALILVACGSEQQEASKPELLIYCGITMAHPIQEIASIVEREKGVKILVNQGGSEDLYKSLAASRKGDLYLPGSASYRERHLEEGLLGDFVHVGYNQAAMIVNNGNPKKLTNDLNQLTRKDIGVVIGNAKTGSIGRETKRILDAVGIYQEVLENSVFLTTDSRNLNRAIRDGEADVIMNWRATAFFEENRDLMEIIDLDPKLAKPKKLLINQLTFSKYPEIARYFMDYAASPKGQEIFRKYGFIDNSAKFD